MQILYTGFLDLHRRGLVRLSQSCTREPVAVATAQHLRNSGGAHLRASVNDVRVHYDCHDAVEIHEANLERCDVYFKRSFSPGYVARLPRHRHKIFPLGLHCSVWPDGVDFFAARRALALEERTIDKARGVLEALDAGNLLSYRARVRHIEGPPGLGLPPRVLFLANAYDPHDHPDRTPEKIDEYVHINETRARCIHILRKALGPAFLGGFTHNAYTAKAFPNLLVDEHAITRRRNYLRTVRAFPICVATTGLHGSIGWKLAEYVALGRAIVSEKLNFQAPGGFREGANFLQFASPEDCAEKCVRLIEDPQTRSRLMLNNALYYQRYLRPDALVLNTLLQVLSFEPHAVRIEGSAPRFTASVDGETFPQRDLELVD